MMRRYHNGLWIEEQDGYYLVGMTKSLQCDAGDVSYAQIASLGSLDAEATLVNIEASKAAIEVPTPLQGEVIERNEAAEYNPSLLDSSAVSDHWLVKLTNVDRAAFERLATKEG